MKRSESSFSPASHISVLAEGKKRHRCKPDSEKPSESEASKDSKDTNEAGKDSKDDESDKKIETAEKGEVIRERTGEETCEKSGEKTGEKKGGKDGEFDSLTPVSDDSVSSDT